MTRKKRGAVSKFIHDVKMTRKKRGAVSKFIHDVNKKMDSLMGHKQRRKSGHRK